MQDKGKENTDQRFNYKYSVNKVLWFVCLMFSINDLCLLNIHKGSISSVTDFFFPLFPTGHGLPAVILVYKGFDGTLCSSTAFVFNFFLLFAYKLVSEWS